MSNVKKELSLTLPVDAMELVLNAVAELPFRVAHSIMATAQAQFTQQQTADSPAPVEPPAA